MTKDLSGVKVALLAANGFSQDDMTTAQKALIAAGASVRMVSPENGLVNSWDGVMWGHHFAVDAPLGSALGADYDILLVPGGQRSIEKLNLTAHTRRFLVSFIESEKPVIIMNNAINLLMLCGQMAGRTVSGPESLRDAVEQAGGTFSQDSVSVDSNIMTGATNAETRAAFVAAMMKMVAPAASVLKAA